MTRKIFLITILILLHSCQSVKDALTGKKYESSDEFLVIKKNPLVLLPDFRSLPTPTDPVDLSREETIEAEIDDILSSIKSQEALPNTDSGPSDISATEEFVLDQIKD